MYDIDALAFGLIKFSKKVLNNKVHKMQLLENEINDIKTGLF